MDDFSPLDWDPWASSESNPPANLGARAIAFAFDWFLVFLVGSSVAFFAFATFGGALPSLGGTSASGLLAVGLLEAVVLLAYFAGLEHGSGQTLGKRLVGIEVTSATDGGRPSWSQAMVRRLPFVAGPLLTFTGWQTAILVGVSVAALVSAARDHARKQGFHDRWAGTVVRRIG